MAGHETLDLGIGVRIPAPQPELSSLRALTSRLGNSTISSQPSAGLGARMCLSPRGNRISV
jgi:hypothetical protein